MSLSTERSMRARLAAHQRWAKCPDYSAATKPARLVLERRFAEEVRAAAAAAGVTLTPVEFERRLAHAKKAYYTGLALKSAQARRERKSS